MLERSLLRSLCQGGIATLPPDNERQLRYYTWSHADHRVIFEALVRLRGVPAGALRDQLPPEVTRMGFPDIDWNVFFSNSAELQTSVNKLIEELLSGSKHAE